MTQEYVTVDDMSVKVVHGKYDHVVICQGDDMLIVDHDGIQGLADVLNAAVRVIESR